jgi:ADP-heptose:LPS heptosyltransferase
LGHYLSTTEFAGYASSGGKGWVTVDLGRDVVDEPNTYRGMLAAQAAAALIGELPDPTPRLTPPEPVEIAARLGAAGYRGGPVLGVSFGAAHPLRRWSGERIADTLKHLQRQPGAYLLIESDDAPRVEVPAQVPTLRWRGSMREMKQALAATDILLCADSGVMHVGAALGCRTVSVFGAGSIGRFAPRGAHHKMYAVEPMPCRPCYDACIYPSPLCMDRIETGCVAALLDQTLASVRTGRAEPLLHPAKSPA